MEWRGASPRIHLRKPHDATAMISGGNSLGHHHLIHERFSNGKGTFDGAERVNMTRIPKMKVSRDKRSSTHADNRNGNLEIVRADRCDGNDYMLTQIDLEESGYLEGTIAHNSDFSFQGSASNLPTDSETEQDYYEEFERIGEPMKIIGTDDRTTQSDTLHNGVDSTSRDMLSMSFTSSIYSDESSLDGELTGEHTRLTTVINSIDPKRLHNYLKRKLKQRESGTILALGSLLPKKRFKGETLHCVRCHQEFDPKHGNKTCELYHRKQDVMKISQDGYGADFACERCGNVFRIEGKWKYKQSLNKKHKCGPCFTGVHTVSTDEVLYEENGISKTCEDHGCIVFYV